jgi:CRISPR/Cas system-associated exonuclease Cas4 (RecB family)
MNWPDDFIFSQSALQDYVDCPRRFELRYVREVQWPALETQSVLEQEATMQRGQTFHHLLHQHALGVPAEAIEATIRDGEMRVWWDAYLRWQAANLPAEREPEITLTAALDERLLMAKYDLIARRDDGAMLIVDWKTGKSKRPSTLAPRMQTLVYPVVLALAGDWLNGGAPIAPDRIKMIYWFAEDARAVEFTLSAEKLAADTQRLSDMLREIAARFEFPLTPDERHCRFCVYRSLCERGETAGRLDEMSEEDELATEVSLDLDALEEIAF